VKEKRIKTEPIDRLFEVFNTDRTKNKEVTRFTLLVRVENNRLSLFYFSFHLFIYFPLFLIVNQR